MAIDFSDLIPRYTPEGREKIKKPLRKIGEPLDFSDLIPKKAEAPITPPVATIEKPSMFKPKPITTPAIPKQGLTFAMPRETTSPYDITPSTMIERDRPTGRQPIKIPFGQKYPEVTGTAKWFGEAMKLPSRGLGAMVEIAKGKPAPTTFKEIQEGKTLSEAIRSGIGEEEIALPWQIHKNKQELERKVGPRLFANVLKEVSAETADFLTNPLNILFVGGAQEAGKLAIKQLAKLSTRPDVVGRYAKGLLKTRELPPWAKKTIQRYKGEEAGLKYRVKKAVGIKQPTGIEPVTDTQLREAVKQGKMTLAEAIRRSPTIKAEETGIRAKIPITPTKPITPTPPITPTAPAVVPPTAPTPRVLPVPPMPAVTPKVGVPAVPTPTVESVGTPSREIILDEYRKSVLPEYNTNKEIVDIDSFVDKIRKYNPKDEVDAIHIKHGAKYEVTISYPHSLGEMGNQATFSYSEKPTIDELKKDIIDTYKEFKKDVNEELTAGIVAKSGRNENIEKAIDNVLTPPISKPERLSDVLAKKAVPTTLTQEARKYDKVEEFVETQYLMPNTEKLPFKEGVPNIEKVKSMKDFISKNSDKYNPKYITMYHSTGVNVPVLKEGLKPTSAKRRRSYQSRSGYVYLANTPESAKLFGDVGNMSNSKVYAVRVDVRDLKADTDQLNNIRSTGTQVGNTVAESIIYGGGARIKGKIELYDIKEVQPKSQLTDIWDKAQGKVPSEPKVPEVEQLPTIEAKRPKVSYREPVIGKKEEIIRRSEIAKTLSEKLNIPIRVGKFRQKALGIYKPKQKIVRVKAPLDIETISHEVGHYLQETLIPDLKPYKTELRSISYTEDPKKSLKEGFAEFIRSYITNPEELQKRTPAFYQRWQELMNKNPEVRDILLSARKDYDRWLNLPATSRVLSQISSTPEKAGMSIKGNIERLYTLTVDELYPLKKYTDIIKKKGRVLEQDDPFVLATLNRGWFGKADTFLQHKTFDTGYNWVGKPLNDIYKPIAKTKSLDEFDAYLVSKRAIELQRRGIKSGIRIEDANATIKELDKKYPEYKKSTEELYEYQNSILQYAHDSGLIDSRVFSKIKALNKSYVPFYRVMEIAGQKGLLGKGFTNISKPIKKIKGSEREIISPSESIVKNTYAIIDAAEKNQIGQALVRLARNHPEELGRIVEKIPTPMTKAASFKLKDALSTFELSDPSMADVPQDLMERVFDIFRPSILRPGDNIITVMEKGKKSFYQVDPDIYKSMSALDRESSNMLIKLLSYPARWLRLGAVSLSPEFLIRNPARDAFSALVYSKAGFIPGLDTMRGIFSVLGKDEMYWRWKMSGAEHSMLVSLDRDYLQKNIRGLIATRGKKLKNVVKHPLEHARILSELGEEATRVGEFKLTMGGGKRWFMMAEKIPEGTPLKSKIMKGGYNAREVTLDFARRGAKTKAINQIIAFWNANVQDIDKIRRSFNDNPVRTMYKIFLGITIPSMLLYLSQKDDPRYQEIPQWQKDLFWIVATDKVIYRIPKPFTIGILFGTGAERMLEYIDKKDPKVFKELAKSVGEGVMPGVIPTAFLAPIEVAANYSFFLKRPVVSRGLEGLPKEMQYNVYTPETIKLIGKALEISPQKVAHFVKGYTGGFGKLSMETMDTILRTTGAIDPPKRPASTLADIPIVRGFIVREPIGSGSESYSRFYEIYEKAQEGESAIKELIKDRNLEAIIKYRKKYPEYAHIKQLRQAATILSALRKQRIKIWESDISPQEKRNKIMIIERTMTTVSRGAIRLVKQGNKGTQ